VALMLSLGCGWVRLALVRGPHPPAPFLAFYPAVAIAAFIGGAGPGFFVILCSVLFGAFVFPVAPAAASWIALFFFGSICVVGFARLRGLRDRTAAMTMESSRLRFVIDHVSDWIFLLDQNGNIEYVNRTACRQLGYEFADLAGRPFADLEAEPKNALLPDLVARCKDGTPSPIEIALVRRDGSRVSAEVSCTAIRTGAAARKAPPGSGDLVIHVAARDITERKQLDQKLREARQWESLGALTGGLAHDFNNLLTSVMGNASLAREILAGDREAEMLLRGVEQAGERCAGLIHLMLATSGYKPRTRDRLRVDELLRRVIGSRPLPPGVTVHVEAESCEFESDRATMETLLDGLISNAAESYGAGGGEVLASVRMGEFPQLGQGSFEEGKPIPGTYLGIVVEDHGCGMSRDVAERAFNPFYSTKFTGRGLGLPAVRGIVRAHSGVLWMRTGPGQGTRVEVWLPAAGYHLIEAVTAHT
jgi:PAS domain S-box-containing protein